MRIDVKKTIQKSGMNLQDVADIMGKSRQTLNYHHRRGTDIDVSTLKRIADIIGCDIIDFFYAEEGEQPSFHCPHCGGKITISK